MNSIGMKRRKRIENTIRKLNQRKRLMKVFGMQNGTIYARHSEKISRSAGYMRDGNVLHFVRVRPTKKTRSRSRYGKVYLPSKHDLTRIERMRTTEQESDTE